MTSPQVKNILAPPITYGETRFGTISVSPPGDLIVGVFYRVSVARADSNGHFIEVGTMTFQR